MDNFLKDLSRPFHPSLVTWVVQALDPKNATALALPNVDVKSYIERLDQVCGLKWSVSYTPWGDRVICNLTIDGVTRSAVGEYETDTYHDGLYGIHSEEVGFKRACGMFGLGRYLSNVPTLWLDYSMQERCLTEKSKVRLHGIIEQHYDRFMSGQEVK